ncbi:hypothetical protein KXV85_003713, partial [Aspergillus fumigatus]
MADRTVEIDAPPAVGSEAPSTVWQIAVLASLAATGTLATNILLPSLPQMASALQVSTPAVTSAITVFLAVFALGQLAVGPISDRFGRRPVVLLSNFGTALDYVLMALAPSLVWLFVGRVISGITTASISTAFAYIADITTPEKRAA